MKQVTKLIAVCAFTLLFISCANAQITALTSTGREVFLYEDGKWAYANEVEIEKVEYPLNKNEFKKKSAARFPVKSTKVNLTVFIDPSKWTFSKGEEEEAAEYKFLLKSEDAYAMLITERAEIPLETLASIALSNAKEVASDAEVIMAEYRMVNGIKVLCMQMKGTMQGIKFMYYGYYYTNTTGSVQFVTYTVQNLFDTYKDEMETMLNGLVEQE